MWLQLSQLPSPEDFCFCGSSLHFSECCQLSLVFQKGGGEKMYLINIAGCNIYRPRIHLEEIFMKEFRSVLRGKFSSGEYTQFEDVQSILHFLVKYFGDSFDNLIPKLASRDFLEFILWQYDLSGKVDRLANNFVLKGAAFDKWASIGPTHRRALKYIAERVTMLAPGDFGSKMPSLDVLDRAFIFAEELINHCIHSDTTNLLRNGTKIKIDLESEKKFFDFQPIDTRIAEYKLRVPKDTQARAKLFQNDSFEDNVEKHGDILDPALIATIGLSWKEALNILQAIKDGCSPVPDNELGTKFVLQDGLIKRVAEIYDKPISSIEKLVAGFSLAKNDLLERAKGDPDYWNPKFEYRAYRRAFFVMPHELGNHLAFSDVMFSESFRVLRTQVCFNEFPSEWRSKEIDSAIGEIAQKQGKWFEEQVSKHLKTIGIFGVSSRISLGRSGKSISLPGEFDFIGWSTNDRSLILLETKMLEPGSEPKFWLNQVRSFLNGSKKEEGFVKKLKRKADWLSQHIHEVCAALIDENIPIDCNSENILCGFITYAPSAASYFIDDFPCVALSEILESYEKYSTWTYEKGKFPLK